MSTIRSYGRSFFQVTTGDGRSLLVFVAIALALTGLFALLLGVSGQFLPHDERFLGMAAGQLCALHGCRVVHFMVHNRISFGGALIAVGLLYLWLAMSPLRQMQAWAWWAVLLSGAIGFASFLAYLGSGYLDTWHGAATLVLLACFVLGLVRSRASLVRPRGLQSLWHPALRVRWSSAHGLGRACLLAAASGLTIGGLSILAIGMTCVFVPQDLAYLGLSFEDLHALNPRLVPLIAHDRIGFGGAVCCCGVTLFAAVWCGRPSRSLWAVLCLAGLAGFGAAIGAHPAIGYNDPVHLAPAVLGATLYLLGLLLTYWPMACGHEGAHRGRRQTTLPGGYGAQGQQPEPVSDIGSHEVELPCPIAPKRRERFPRSAN
jgi:hypothetical protein